MDDKIQHVFVYLVSEFTKEQSDEVLDLATARIKQLPADLYVLVHPKPSLYDVAAVKLMPMQRVSQDPDAYFSD